MNTIPSIFNERQINRTVLGGKELMRDVKMKVSVILLNRRGSQFRIPMIENLLKCGFESIVSIENSTDNFNIEEFSHKFPYVKFVIPLESATDGELINIGMAEVNSDYVLVLRDTLKIDGEILTARIAEKLSMEKLFCVVPRLVERDGSSFPIVFSPGVNGTQFEVLHSSTVIDGCPTLYPLDYIGYYDRKAFMQLGGYDYTIKESHWQNLDLCFRAWLWGHRIKLTTLFSLAYASDIPVEDVSANLSYSRFYMKNLLPRFEDDHGVIPKSSIFVYLLRSGCGLVESLRQFFDARSWVKRNMYRFKFDAKYLIENWGKI